MRERRTPGLPRMRGRTLAVASAVLLAASLAAGLGMRASLTDYGADPAALDDVPFVAQPSTPGIVSLYTTEDVVAEAEASGTDLGSLGLEGAARLFGTALDDVDQIAPVVFTGRFTGSRTYVYETFRCEVEVTGVVKGEGLEVGGTVCVYDPFMVLQEGGGVSESGGIFTEGRSVRTAANNYNWGACPLREGQEYLFFVEPKTYPEGMGAPATPAYVQVFHPYARIPTDVAEHPERVLVAGRGGEAELPELTFGEARAFDLIAGGEDAADVWRATCEGILLRVLGE